MSTGAVGFDLLDKKFCERLHRFDVLPMVMSRDDKQVSLHLYRSERVMELPRSTKGSTRDPRVEKIVGRV
ncbi:MAG: hypothetical protein E6L07_07535 [Verrucomicrobia bacterium]|nr:MAG: hypothetical protein E6L07_07535 [Verrucomicrobiota bacterium]